MCFKTSQIECRRKKNWYTPPNDKTEHFGYSEKIWISSGAKLKRKVAIKQRLAKEFLKMSHQHGNDINNNNWQKFKMLSKFKSMSFFNVIMIKLLERQNVT